jgi:hypothetical protein
MNSESELGAYLAALMQRHAQQRRRHIFDTAIFSIFSMILEDNLIYGRRKATTVIKRYAPARGWRRATTSNCSSDESRSINNCRNNLQSSSLC